MKDTTNEQLADIVMNAARLTHTLIGVTGEDDVFGDSLHAELSRAVDLANDDCQCCDVSPTKRVIAQRFGDYGDNVPEALRGAIAVLDALRAQLNGYVRSMPNN